MLAGQMSSSAADSALAIVASAVRHGTEREYQIALQIYSNPPTPQLRTAAIAGLTGSKDIRLLQQTAMMLTSGAVAQEDMSKFLYVSLFVRSISEKLRLTLCFVGRVSQTTLNRVDSYGASFNRHGRCWNSSSRGRCCSVGLLPHLSSRKLFQARNSSSVVKLG